MNGDDLSGIAALNQYMHLIHKLEGECTNAESRRDFWLDLYNKIHPPNIDSNIAIAMVLIHPSFEDVREKSRSGFKAHLSGLCELGRLIHGADCPNIAVEMDHIFPYSLGGVTRDVNRADLCKSCNRGKSNTVVGYFPWDGKVPDWVIEEVWATRKRIGK